MMAGYGRALAYRGPGTPTRCARWFMVRAEDMVTLPPARAGAARGVALPRAPAAAASTATMACQLMASAGRAGRAGRMATGAPAPPPPRTRMADHANALLLSDP